MKSRPLCVYRKLLNPAWLSVPVFILLIFSILPVLSADSTPVYVVEAMVGPVVEDLPLSGTITSEQNASLSARVSGLVAKVNVDAGDHVRAGDVLLELDAELASMDLNRAQAALNESQIALKEAQRLSDEAQDLVKNKNIPETTAQARLADVELKAAAVKRLEAEHRQYAEIVKRHTVIAPFAGAISRKMTEAGEWVNTGTPVLELVATDELRLDLQVPQEYFNLISTSTPVSIFLDTTPGKPYTGQITAIVPVNDSSARTFLARIRLTDAEDAIIPGMSAKAVFNVQRKEEALQLPRDATIQYPDGRNTVWVVKNVEGEYIVSEQQVQLGRSLSNNVIVRSGLAPGSIVVIRGNETLQEGQAVQILEQATADKN